MSENVVGWLWAVVVLAIVLAFLNMARVVGL